MKSLLLINEDVVKSLFTLDEAMKAVRAAFIAQAVGEGMTFPVVKQKYTNRASFSLKSGYMSKLSTVGVKSAGSWLDNGSKGLPTVQATVLLVDHLTGEPLAIIAGKTLTTLRTGAAGGVAAEALSKNDAATLGVIGTGVQGEIQTEAVLSVRPSIKEIHCCNPMGQVSERYKARFGDRARIVAHDNPAAATKGADIVITATPSTKPLIDLHAVSPGAHVNAMGCDSKGKREISGELLAKATRFVDSAEQARGIGEHQYAPDLEVTEIGTLLAGGARRARTEGEITLFDSTGVAFQDLASARQIYDLALSQGKGQRIDWPT